ncbi:uncharacterized protein TNCV_3379411 [Trichonephila clavipes]|nr:uncharacterized protein TNCV_3379411 [Trichonephila clavipes]
MRSNPPISFSNLLLSVQLYDIFQTLTVARKELESCGEAFVQLSPTAQNEIAVVPDFHKRILFSDEAHFWLNGYVNKQNCHIWSEPNPQVYDETPLHPERLTVWCALWAGGIIGSYFFKNDEGHNATANSDRFLPNSTDKFGVIVGSMETTNHKRTLSIATRLVEVALKTTIMKALVNGITRRALFNVWNEEKDPKRKIDAVLSLVRSTTDFDNMRTKSN